MATEIAVQQSSSHPLAILQSAVDKGASLEQITALMGLAERYELNQDKKRFREAMVLFKLDPPKILKNKHVSFKTDKGTTEYDHATLDAVCDQIVKRLAQSGITHRWVPSQPTGIVTVTCILSLGVYSEETPLSATPDTSGGKNSIQAIASTVSYMERYSLLAATGMATGMPDNDGAGDPQAAQDAIVADLLGAKTLEELKNMFSDAYRLAAKRPDAQKAFKAASDKRKAELEGK